MPEVSQDKMIVTIPKQKERTVIVKFSKAERELYEGVFAVQERKYQAARQDLRQSRKLGFLANSLLMVLRQISTGVTPLVFKSANDIISGRCDNPQSMLYAAMMNTPIPAEVAFNGDVTECTICLGPFEDAVITSKCHHMFCQVRKMQDSCFFIFSPASEP